MINVTKYSGETEPFDEAKLRESLQNAGAAPDLINRITASINKMLYDGISTKEIYREAFSLLRAESQKSAGRYKLKEAVFELGPSGYPFERFIGELLQRLGYEIEVGITVQGDCVSHEVDVVGHKGSEYIMAECKFHNREENRCNVQVPLYIQSRFLDIKNKWSSLPGHENHTHTGWIVTNTRFTSDAQTYGKCVGLTLLGWDYPRNNGLKDLIARTNLHPVTCLSALNTAEKNQLLKKDVIFCKQICENKNVLKSAGINPRNVNSIAKEAGAICNL